MSRSEKRARAPRWLWQQPGWPAFTFDLGALSAAISAARRAQGIVLGKAQAVGMAHLAETRLSIWTEEARATAKIEGEQLDLQAVRSSVARRLGLHVKGPITRHVDGLVEVMADAVDGWEKPLTIERLCGWQAALFPTGYVGLNRILVGKLRTHREAMQVVSGPIGTNHVHFEAPPSPRVPKEMARFITWFDRSYKEHAIDGLVRAAVAHLWFETIHPFEDGNGRVGRALMDLALAQDARLSIRIYSLSRCIEANRDSYYAELERAQRGPLDVTPWIAWLLERFRQACQESESIIDLTLERTRFWVRHRDVVLNERQKKMLDRLLEAGPLGFTGGLSTKKYMASTGASRATAFRELDAMVRAGLLVQRGQARGTRYYPAIDGWIPD